ncbi:RNA-binding protein [Lactococcus nasutitermitis]|uniref:RNA-binding protein n=1 Tax=Lactococcus nasutitermitis TaxID=1652957 RepID=A0ABV9JB00_9LACT|nr:RNA-binding protein [Lactococcus nasutitermitis]
MIGQIVNITKFGLFVNFVITDSDSVSNFDIFDSSVKKNKKQKGLLRWSSLPKKHLKYQVGDFIGIDIAEINDNGKIDLKFIEKDFQKTFGDFIGVSTERLEELEKKNKELRQL